MVSCGAVTCSAFAFPTAGGCDTRSRDAAAGGSGAGTLQRCCAGGGMPAAWRADASKTAASVIMPACVASLKGRHQTMHGP